MFLLLLFLVPWLMQQLRVHQTKKTGSLRFSNVARVQQIRPSRWTRYYRLLPAVRVLTLILLIVAFARPQSSTGDEAIDTEGIDIILTLDVSGSMQAEDFQPNRLEAAKRVAAEFIRGRRHDRIGLVVFAGHSAIQAPLTIDYDVVLTLLDNVQNGMLQEDGTAIGMAVANSVNRLRNSAAKSKVIILLTDGVNNKGEIDPLTAANLAKSMQLKIYTIGAGSNGPAVVTVNDPLFGPRQVQIQAELDEKTLAAMAELTGGKYFRATDEKSLSRIYAEIDQLEKTKIEMQQYKEYVELFPYFVSAAFALLTLEILLTQTRLRKIP